MNTTRLAKLILCAALIVAILVALQTFKLSANSKANVPAYTGRGDYQRWKLEVLPTYHWKGRLPALRSAVLPNPTPEGATTSATKRSSLNRILRHRKSTFPMSGLGNLHCFEAMQEIEYAGRHFPHRFCGWKSYGGMVGLAAIFQGLATCYP